MKIHQNQITGGVMILFGIIATPFVVRAFVDSVAYGTLDFARMKQADGVVMMQQADSLARIKQYDDFYFTASTVAPSQELALKWECEDDPSQCGGGGSWGGGGRGYYPRCTAYSSLYGCLQWGAVGGGKSAMVAFVEDYAKQQNGLAWLSNLAKSEESSLALGLSGASASNPDDAACDAYVVRADSFMRKAAAVAGGYKSGFDPSKMEDDDFLRLSAFATAADEALVQYTFCVTQ